MIEYGRRTQRLPPPPHIVYADLASPTAGGVRAWLNLLEDEVPPTVLAADTHSRVVWSSLWLGRPEDQIVLEVAPEGAETALTIVLLAVSDPPDARLCGHIRKRMSELLYCDLRYSYGQ